MSFCRVQEIAVIGAGLAGVACARALTQAGHSVRVEWAPKRAAGSLPSEEDGRCFEPAPSMPALRRRRLDGAAATGSFAGDGLTEGIAVRRRDYRCRANKAARG